MNRFWAALRQRQDMSLISKAANDLIRKELVPKHTIKYIQDNIRTDALNRPKDRIQEISCPVCHITLPSRFLLRQHIKIHTEKLRYMEKLKDDASITYNAPVYFE